jgi:hypothetical protein
MLIYGREAHLRPTPSGAFSVVIFIRKYLDELSNDALDVGNYDLAMATVYGAARDYAMQIADDEAAQRANSAYREKIGLLQSMSSATVSQERRMMRTF